MTFMAFVARTLNRHGHPRASATVRALMVVSYVFTALITLAVIGLIAGVAVAVIGTALSAPHYLVKGCSLGAGLGVTLGLLLRLARVLVAARLMLRADELDSRRWSR